MSIYWLVVSHGLWSLSYVFSLYESFKIVKIGGKGWEEFHRFVSAGPETRATPSALTWLLWEQHLVEQTRFAARREVTTMTSCDLDRRKFPASIPDNSPQPSCASLNLSEDRVICTLLSVLPGIKTCRVRPNKGFWNTCEGNKNSESNLSC